MKSINQRGNDMTVTYTAEQVATMTENYRAAPTAETVEALATEFGRTVASVRAKLAQLGLYQSKKATATKEVRETKAVLARKIFADEAMATDLEKLTKATLAALVAGFAAVTEQRDEAVTE